MTSIFYKNPKLYNFFVYLIHGKFLKERGKIISEMVGKNKKVFDVGCGSCEVSRYIDDSCSYRGIDLNPVFIKTAKKNGLRVEKGDVFDPENYSSCDIIIAMDMLHHIDSRKDKLISISERFAKKMIIVEQYWEPRRLKKESLLKSGLMKKLFELFSDFDGINDPDDMKVYTREELLFWLGKQGFTIKNDYKNFLFAEKNFEKQR